MLGTKFIPFCPESEYYHQKHNIHPQHLTKLIDITLILQNLHEKVFNKGALQFCGLFVCAGRLDIIKWTKIPLIYSVARYNLWGLKLCLGGLRPP